jgi:hypothetical protein
LGVVALGESNSKSDTAIGPLKSKDVDRPTSPFALI